MVASSSSGAVDLNDADRLADGGVLGRSISVVECFLAGGIRKRLHGINSKSSPWTSSDTITDAGGHALDGEAAFADETTFRLNKGCAALLGVAVEDVAVDDVQGVGALTADALLVQ